MKRNCCENSDSNSFLVVRIHAKDSGSGDYCSGASPGRRFEAGVHLTETGQRFDELTANFN